MNNEISIDKNFDIAVKHHIIKNFKLAKDLYIKILEIEHDHIGATNNIGLIFQELGEYTKAIDYYERALIINPNYLDSLYNLGLLLSQLGIKEKAITYFEKIAKINPNYKHSPYFNLGLIAHELGEGKEAINFYEKSIEINPNYIQSYINLGLINAEQGEYFKSITIYEKGIKKKPNHINLYLNLGISYFEIGEYDKTISCYEKIILINPDNKILSIALSNLLKLPNLDQIKNIDYKVLKKLFIFFLNDKNSDYAGIFSNAYFVLFKEIDYDQVLDAFNSNVSLLKNPVIQELLTNDLFLLILNNCISSSLFFEKLLIKIRSELLQNVSDDTNIEILSKNYFFVAALAEQCWINQFIWFQSKKEVSLIENLSEKLLYKNDIPELYVTILACYKSLEEFQNSLKSKVLNHKTTNNLFNNIIKKHIYEPLKEKQLLELIQKPYLINNIVSKEIRKQYEETPHNKWINIHKPVPANFFYILNNDIKPNIFKHAFMLDKDDFIIEYKNKFNKPNVLIAGCGTGSHTVLATRYSNANIIGIDLSLPSLAYAKRKTDELNLKNIEYLQLDILQLDSFDKKFDIIECSGTLHHLKNPNDGIKKLIECLEPHGFLKLGLLSWPVKNHMNIGKEFVKKNNLINTNEEIRKFRQTIINGKDDLNTNILKSYIEFYAMSALKDLLFYDHEHFFTIPKIKEILKNFNLEFLGFNFSRLSIHKEYSILFPNDKEHLSLDNWHLYEIKNPSIFHEMYNFWVRKIL